MSGRRVCIALPNSPGALHRFIEKRTHAAGLKLAPQFYNPHSSMLNPSSSPRGYQQGNFAGLNLLHHFFFCFFETFLLQHSHLVTFVSCSSVSTTSIFQLASSSVRRSSPPRSRPSSPVRSEGIGGSNPGRHSADLLLLHRGQSHVFCPCKTFDSAGGVRRIFRTVLQCSKNVVSQLGSSGHHL